MGSVSVPRGDTADLTPLKASSCVSTHTLHLPFPLLLVNVPAEILSTPMWCTLLGPHSRSLTPWGLPGPRALLRLGLGFSSLLDFSPGVPSPRDSSLPHESHSPFSTRGGSPGGIPQLGLQGPSSLLPTSCSQLLYFPLY